MLSLVFALIFAVGALGKPSTLIYEGQNAVRGEFPHMVTVQILKDNKFQHFCGGAILTPKLILTAAHCVVGLEKYAFRIIAGIDNQKKSNVGQIRNVLQRIPHPKYPGTVQPYDVAVLTLGRALVFDAYVKPIALPTPNSVPTGKATVSGWGDILNGGGVVLPDQLQKITLSILDPTVCKKTMKMVDVELNICTTPTDVGGGPCGFDSGSPLISNGQVIGIVSYGFPYCGTPGIPEVYTRVSKFIDFIKSHMK